MGITEHPQGCGYEVTEIRDTAYSTVLSGGEGYQMGIEAAHACPPADELLVAGRRIACPRSVVEVSLAGVFANEGLQPLLGSLDDEVTGFAQQMVVRPRPPQSSECAPIARCNCESVGGPVGRLIRPGSCLAGVSVRPDLDERLA